MVTSKGIFICIAVKGNISFSSENGKSHTYTHTHTHTHTHTKKQSKADYTNYRPISFVSNIEKITEKLMFK